MNSPGPSPVDIQNHLYASFLEARTADVALRVRGSWAAVYRLHRVVLIQSGFFRSLFTAGFVESSASLRSHHRGPDEIDIVFDDQNITRSAFEICISRLYGGGPPLHVPPSLIPSASHPLTHNFLNSESHDVPPNHHPATPRFLLSILATSIYLSIPSITSQALSAILNTVGPTTVIKYLNFALGTPVGPHAAGEPVAAIGLEHVAHMEEGATSSNTSIRTVHGTKGKDPTDSMEIETDPEESIRSISQLDYHDLASSSDDDLHSASKPSYHYGALSDKIGEACACWLARWAIDILAWEDGKESSRESIPILSRKRAMTIPFDNSMAETETSYTRSKANRIAFPIIWGRGGLSATWVAALVSADTLFVKDELERYNFARSVVELRRKEGILEDEEKEWSTMFSEGIYYANMTMEEIILISQDISPTTNRTFVPLHVLQAAHWNHSVLRHHITYRSSTNSVQSSGLSQPIPSTPPPREKELGITHTTADILAKISGINEPSDANTESSRPYFPVPGDSSLRIGDGGLSSQKVANGVPLSMEDLFTSTHMPSVLAPQTPGRGSVNPRIGAAPKISTSEANFFGLLPPRHIGSSCIQCDSEGKVRWSPYPPFRFAVEFWDLDSLKEKSRLHSHTVWYAGNLFNVYVQVVKKKAQTQLGIYLHRQSSVDPIPPPSAQSSIARQQGNDLAPGRTLHSRGPSLTSLVPSSSTPPTAHYSPSIHPLSRTTTPLTAPSSSSVLPSSPSSVSYMSNASNSMVPATSSPVAPPQPYRDPRPQISAYFTISCASATGSSQTRFTSAPDVFSVSQSWGWKSSSLRAEEYNDVEGPLLNSAVRGKEVSLRATVVLGLV